MPVGVHPGREQGVYPHHPAAFPDLEHQGVGRDERVRALVQRAGPERLDLLVQVLGHHRDLRLRQRCHPQRLHQLLHPAGRHTQQVTRRDHRRQRPLGAFAPLQQPVREVGPGPQLRDRHVQRAGPGVEVPVPVPVAGVHPLLAAFAVPGAADRVRLGAHQRLDERGQHGTQQVRARRGELIGQEHFGVDRVSRGHRVGLLRQTLRGPSKDHAVTVLVPATTRPRSSWASGRTPLCRTRRNREILSSAESISATWTRSGGLEVSPTST